MLTNQQILEGFEFLSSKLCPKCLIYNSIDVRLSSFKASPVDNNIFPAGFNNIGSESISKFSTHLQKYFEENAIKTVLIITEDHTRNEGYLQNILLLKNAIKQANMRVEVATFSLDAHTTRSGIFVEKLEIFDGNIGTKTMQNPDFILLNNDLSGQMNRCQKITALENAKNVLPNPKLGWNYRKKSSHFTAYSKIANEIAQKIGFDPWLIDAQFTTANCLAFTSQRELENLTDSASDLFKKIKEKYKEYKIPNQPAIFLKSESGTYGLGVEKISKPEDLLNPNRTFRKKILYNKSKIANTQFLLQEAVPTRVLQGSKTAECTFYMVCGKPFGGFYRMHAEKNDTDNLNSKGAEFAPLEPEKITQKSISTLIVGLSTVAVSMENGND